MFGTDLLEPAPPAGAPTPDRDAPVLGDGPRSAGTATIGEGVSALAAEDLDHLSDAALAGDLFHLLPRTGAPRS